MRRRISEIIQDLKDIITEHDLNIKEDILFVEAMTTYRGEQMGKSHPPFKKLQTTDIEEPTSKQKYFLKMNKDKLLKAGFKIDDIKTKEEASKVIESFKNPPQENKDLYDEKASLL